MRCFVVLITLLMPAVIAGQTQMVRAAGMPLPDGALAPGMLTVRIVRGAFDANLPNQAVEIEVDGRSRQSSRTGVDGRVQFAHVPIGANVRAWAVVDGERLESERFDMPAQSGVRVLFVAGGAAVPSPEPMTTEPSRDVRVTSPPKEVQNLTIVRVVVISLTVLAFVIVAIQQTRA